MTKVTIDLTTDSSDGNSQFWFDSDNSSQVYFSAPISAWVIPPGGEMVFQLQQNWPATIVLTMRQVVTVQWGSPGPIRFLATGNLEGAPWTPGTSWSSASYVVPNSGSPVQVTIINGCAESDMYISQAAAIIFPLAPQKKTNWCWAACALAVTQYYEDENAYTQQCQVVEQTLHISGCCSGDQQCNYGGDTIAALLPKKNAMSINRTTPNPGSDVAGQILAGRPILAGIEWAGTSLAHQVVITGTCLDQSMLLIQDPHYGTSYITYQTFCKSYQGTGSWIDTQYTFPAE